MPQPYNDMDSTDHSHYAREVLGTVPRWSVRWGTNVIVITLATLVFITWWIKYPEVVPAKVLLTTSTPPARVVAKVPGKIVQINVRDQQAVAAGEVLGVIENTADTAAVIAVRRELRDSASALGCNITAVRPGAPVPRLGPVQDAFAAYQARCTEYRDEISQAQVGRRMQTLAQQRERTGAMLDIYARQRETLHQKRALLNKDIERYARLQRSGLVSDKQLDDKRSELLDLKRAEEQIDADMAMTRVELVRVDKEGVDITSARELRVQNARARVAEAYQNLLAQMGEWEKNYLLRAPLAGTVTFFDYWSTNQHVAAGAEVMTVVPRGERALIGKLRVPLNNSGKLRTGQPVFIRLDAYPSQEYGLIKGYIRTISLVPRQNHYAVEVALPAPLRTTFGKQLAFMHEMQGRADVVTQDSRLLERIFYQLTAPLTHSLSPERYAAGGGKNLEKSF